jgi:hypothetical protein
MIAARDLESRSVFVHWEGYPLDDTARAPPAADTESHSLLRRDGIVT